ncbi:PQQ-binding-like beta-propeller repeat protein [Myceligenerans pegani]|uniref:PQQ-binding-like beta-propeller repeat protein n=1 Tax=Myceligenerans pegani TaxID=2776917 RepID=A0ABR9N2S3_9MICO|nr:PQQ-binding-like beta-propeller repeat protein [Myceligenerans sp. TRM 65318]MBE1877953.1 PQQ-binding-like beta-propeller repeat protein [Myceligenerans sp. TRM 65318]MBE3020224.1 PQQ-binding-like beta-propeller repeat protein [Myceligenerans sp. TRM 65318]
MGRQDRIVFDLVEGEHEINEADDGRGGQGGPSRSGGGELLRDLGSAFLARMVGARGWVSRHRAASLIATGVAAAVVLTAAGFGTVREQHRVDLLRTAPGGVESLAGPPEEAWRHVPAGATNLAGWYGFGTGAVAIGRNVVFLEGEQSAVNRSGLHDLDERLRWDDAELVAIDVRSGEESWRVPLGDDPECTPPEAGGAARVLDEIVCLVGRPDERSVIAVDAAGEASEPRRLAPEDLRAELTPAWNGLVVRAHSRGEAPDVDCSDAAMFPRGCTLSDDDPTWRVVVHAEDARTGDEVWRETVPWNDDLSSCLETTVNAGEPVIDPTALSLSVWGGLIHVRGCGVEASFRADGKATTGDDVRLSESGDLFFVQDYDYESNETTATVRTADGAEVLTTNGWLPDVDATDGTTSDMFVLMTELGSSLHGYRLDGSPAWELENVAEAMVGRVGQVGIFRRHDGRSTGIDLDSGDVLWEQSADEVIVDGAVRPPTAFTDGRSLLLASTPDAYQIIYGDDGDVLPQDAGRSHLIAVDVGTGRTRWTVESEDTIWFAVDGRLLSVAADGSLVGYRG